ncbi:MAG: OmpA family protein [Cyclobacteriaceae bacterium]|nr:PD40 domain-containing protein [Cyclobacteriaceae bacterium]MCH8516128.1 OmpA family protein [Cyclobacteriaceae bacterium]
MKHLLIPILCGLGLLLALPLAGDADAQAQEAQKMIERGDRFFQIGNFSKAKEEYLQAEEAGSTEPLMYYRLGVSYFNERELNEQLKAISYLEKADAADVELPAEIDYYLGLMYHKDTDMDRALERLRKYRDQIDPKNTKLKKQVDRDVEIAINAKRTILNPKDIRVFNLGDPINSEYTEYNPVVSADQSVMAYTVLAPVRKGSSTMQEKIMVTYKNQSGQWGKPEQIELNTSANVGTAGLSADGREMIIFIGGPNNTGDLYTITRQGRKWSNPIKMGNHVNSRFLESTASVTQDGRTIYFASNRPGGYGGLDIWKVEKNEDGNWESPENLGPEVNTEFDEDAPYIHPDGRILFFTSDGHYTIGGKDIFKSIRIGGKWRTPENMGYPINTPANDSYFTLDASGRKGYFSSDRQGGFGAFDIYSINMPDDEANIPLTMMKGRVLGGEDKKPVPTSIKVINNETGKQLDFVYDPDPATGNYLIIFPPGKDYDMIIQADDYLPYSININIPDQDYFYSLYQEIYLKPVKQFDVMVGQEVEVKNAFYDTKANETYDDLRKANESRLVRNDSIDLYELMDDIIASGDDVAFEYLLELMYSIDPIEEIDFEGDERSEIADRVYYYEDNPEENLESKVIDGEVIFTLPTFYVTEEANKQKERRQKIAEEKQKIDPNVLGRVFKVYFGPAETTISQKFRDELDGIIKELAKFESLGVEISGFASQDGDAEKNKQLSTERAVSVLNYLNLNDVPRRKIVAKGLGIDDGSGSKEEGRRVEIKIIQFD